MKENKKQGIFKPLCAFLLALVMVLTHVVGAMDVYAAEVKAPTVNPVLYDATTISGDKVAKAKVNNKNVIATVHVILKDKDGTVKATLSNQPKSGTKWKVDLPEGVKVAKGDTVTVYQQIGEDKSPEVTANAQPSKAVLNEDNLKMPTGEIWIEQYVANIVNADEKAEAIDLLKKANPTIAGDIKSVEFKITGVDPKTASYIVTYTDDSVSEEIQAPDLTINKVTETSRSPEIGSITIADNVVKGKLAGEGPFDGIKVQLILRVGDANKGTFCNENKCTVDKNSSTPVDVTLQNDGTFSYALQAGESLELDQIVGVSVKEPHKFVSCSTTTVGPVIPKKTEVKDPRKLTNKDKEAIDKAIRDAYIIDGVSKLPNGTGFVHGGVPAFIEFDKDGNARIISPNNVEFKKVDGKVVYEKNADGSYKVKDETKVITTPAKDLVKNIKPDAPTVALSDDKKNVTITPKNVDTDANIITVSYTGKDSNPKTTKASKDENGTWSITEGEGTVDANGVVTLEVSKIKGETVVTATVTDKGGIADDDTTPLTSDPGTLTVKETIAEKVEALGGLDPVALKKWVGDKVDWKDGVQAKNSAKKTEVNNLLAGATFTDETETKRSTDKSGDFTGKVKVKFSDGSEIVVENQKLYVSDLVSPSDKENLPEDAIDVQLKLGEGVKVGDKVGNKETPVTAKTYKVKPGTDLSTEKVSKTEKTCFEDVGATVSDDTYVDVTWNDKDKGTNFKATAENNVFTATATKTYKVTVVPNGGKGTEIKDTKKTGETYTLPAKDTFTAPENQEFKAWEVDDKEVAPGTEITIDKDIEVKAIWKDIMVNVSYNANGGSGEMTGATQKKGSKYTLPENTFKAPDVNQEFKAWEVNGKEVAAGTEITLDKDTEIKAIWKDIMVNVSYNANGGSGEMKGETQKKGSKYTLPENSFKAPDENQEFKAWEVNGKEVAAGTEITLDKDTEIKASWKAIEVKVKFQTEAGASGTMDPETVNKGSKYELPKPTFTPEEGKEFAGWKVGDGTELKKTGETIDISGDVTLTAVWKDIEYKVTFNGNEGTGNMTGATVKKGGKYTLPDNSFGAPSDKQEFKTWEIDGKEVEPGTEITVEKDTEVKAIWKDKTPVQFKVTFNGNTGSGSMQEATVKKGGEYTLPANGFTAPNGKEFKCWLIGTEEKNPKDTITINDNTEVKALWKDKTSNPETPHKPEPSDSKKPSAPAITWRGLWYLGEKTEPAKAVQEMEIGRHYKYLYGYVDKTVRPEGMITRSEAAALIARLAELDMTDKTKPNFKDTPSAWYNSAINIMVKKDLMFGDKNGNFRPNEPITRGEFARALYYIDKKNDKVAPFADVKGHEFEAAINQAYGNDRIAGYPDGSFKPNAYIQRAEAARILNQYADRNVNIPGMEGVKKDLIRFTDINENHWAYCEVMEAANSHEYQRAKGSQVETWLRILDIKADWE